MIDFETNGMQIVKRISQICDEKRIVKKSVSEALKLPDNCFANWSSRGTVPAGDICIRIADYLGVSVEWLVTGKEAALSSEERTLLKQWKVLSEEQKDTIRTLLDKWVSEHQAREKKESDA